VIRNNLFEDVDGGRWGGDGRFLTITDTVAVTIDHNTVLQTGNIVSAYGAPSSRFVLTNNVLPHNAYGIHGDGEGSGNRALARYFPGSRVRGNVIAGGERRSYPAGNFYPPSLDAVGFVDADGGDYRLARSSRYRRAATDGMDVGADFRKLPARWLD
jgi:hypothetical protein